MKKTFLDRASTACGLIMICGIAAYFNTFTVPFIFDDYGSIVDNPVVKELGNFLSGAGYSYNPRRFVGYLTLALNYRLGGLEVAGYHAFNLSVHLLTALLVYGFCRLTFRTPFLLSSRLAPQAHWVALAAGLLFVAHPVQTQAVTYIIQRLASLASLFYLLSLTLYAQARLLQVDGGSSRKVIFCFLGSVSAAVLAMLTKEIAFTLPFMILLYEFSFFRSGGGKRLLTLLPVILTIVIIPLSIVGTDKPLGDLLSDVSEKTRVETGISRTEYLFTQFRVIVTYLRLLVLPVNQNLDYDYPIYTSFLQPQVLLSFLLLASLLALAVYLYWGSRLTNPKPLTPETRLLGFGILWFFLALSVESSVIPIADVIYEHRLYLPSIGVSLAVPVLLLSLLRGETRKYLAVVGVAVIVLSFATWNRNVVWADAVVFWKDVISKSPNKHRPHNNLGSILLYQRGLADEAVREYETALRLAPQLAESHYNLGAAYDETGLREQALTYYHSALKLDPDHFNAHNNIGIIMGEMGYLDKAIEHFERALSVAPDYYDANVNIAHALELTGRPEKAAVYRKRAAELSLIYQ